MLVSSKQAIVFIEKASSSTSSSRYIEAVVEGKGFLLFKSSVDFVSLWFFFFFISLKVLEGTKITLSILQNTTLIMVSLRYLHDVVSLCHKHTQERFLPCIIFVSKPRE